MFSYLRRAFARTLELEVFSAGTWNDLTYTRADLEEMARNFIVLKNLLKPMLKLGHDDAQKWFGQEDGAPALGWVTNLRVTPDDKLVANVAGVPDAVARLIAAQAYRRVSAEIYHDIEFEENGEKVTLGKALGAVALLGADLPAVTNLADLAALFGQAHREVRTFTGGQLRRCEFETPAQEEPVIIKRFAADPAADAEKERLRVALENATKTINEQKDVLTSLKADVDKHKQAEADALATGRAKEFVQQRNAALAPLEELVKAGSLPPYLRDAAHVEVLAQERGYAGGPLKFSQELLLKFIDAVRKGEVKPFVAEKEKGKGGAAKGVVADSQDAVDANRQLADKVAALMQGNKALTFEQATTQALRASPELAQANLLEQLGEDGIRKLGVELN